MNVLSEAVCCQLQAGTWPPCSVQLQLLISLAITIGSILTLFAAMQLTGRIRWSEVFARKPPTELNMTSAHERAQ